MRGLRRFAAVAAALAAAAAAGPAGAAEERGTAGDDRVVLTGGPDRFRGLGGDDRIRGEGGGDAIHGGGGDDRLVGGGGRDAHRGGPGRDRLLARDGRVDRLVAGGPGDDVCVVDEGEAARTRGCEVIRGDGGGEVPPDDPPVTPPDDPDDPPVVVEPGLSDAYVNRNWTPTPYDTCPKSLHDRYSVVGPDGKLYPTWHPPEVTDPATGETCSFGHEHGANPAGSDIFGWVSSRLSAPGFEDRAGIPFGYGNEELTAYAASNPGVATRFEDHVGHKIDWVNDVDLLDADGRYVRDSGGARIDCDYLFKVHQGSHSADATTNNVHELVFAARCSDGTELLTTTMARFGSPNTYSSSCSPGTAVQTGTSSPYPAGGGIRLIPNRACLEEYVLVPPAQTNRRSDLWALYENWQLESELTTASGSVVASFDPWFAVRNPSRYAWPGTGIGRTLDAAWETDPGDGGVANAPPWTEAQAEDPFEYRDPRSPFDGAQRDFYIHDVEVRNEGGSRNVWTDPYGGNASATPFPGAICQIVSPTDNSGQPELKRRLFGRDEDFGAGNGVHAPN
jgi:hemolysin type calcium-binding protein